MVYSSGQRKLQNSSVLCSFTITALLEATFPLDAPKCPPGELCATPPAVSYDGHQVLNPVELTVDFVAENVRNSIYVNQSKWDSLLSKKSLISALATSFFR